MTSPRRVETQKRQCKVFAMLSACVLYVPVRGTLWCSDRLDNMSIKFQSPSKLGATPKFVFVTPLTQYLPACPMSAN